MRVLVTSVVVQNGKPQGPIHSHGLEDRVPAGATVLRMLGVTAYEVRETLKAGKGYADRCLPLSWVLAFVPACYWPAVYSIISYGPAVEVFAQEAAETLAATPTRRRDHRRAGETINGQPMISRSFIRGCLRPLWALFDALKDIRKDLGTVAALERPLDRKLLRKWRYVPDRIDLSDIKMAEPKVGAPTVPQQRLQDALNTRHAKIENRPGRLPKGELCDLVILATLPVLGERGHAFVNARVGDIDPECQWPDGIQRPSITLYPGKTRDSDESFTRPLPRRAWGYMRAWIGWNKWDLGMTDQPLFPGVGGDRSLAGLTVRVGGAWRGVGGNNRTALIPLRGEPIIGNIPKVGRRVNYDWGVPIDANGWPKDEPVNNPYRGYPPHSYRKACHLAVGSVHALMTRHDMMPPDLTGIPAKYFKKVITTHALGKDVDAVYDDIPGLADLMLATIIQPLEDYLWTGTIEAIGEAVRDSRYGPDVEAIRSAYEQVRAAERAFGASSSELERLHADTERLQDAKRAAVEIESKLAISDELEAVAARISRLKDQLLQLGIHGLPSAKQALAEAHETSVLIPEGVTTEEHDAAVRAATGQSAQPKRQVPTTMADSLNFGRVARFLGVTDASIRQYYQRMLDGGAPRRLNRILRSGLPFDEVWDPKRPKYDRRLLVRAIDRDALTPREANNLDELRAEQWIDDSRHTTGLDGAAA
jgi:hypothetical protein